MTTPRDHLAQIDATLGKQSRQLNSLKGHLVRQAESTEQIGREFDALKVQYKANQERLHELQLGSKFRELMERVSELTLPFHYVVPLVLPAGAAARVIQPFATTSHGWFFAERVFASYRPTGGAQAGQWRPLTHADPAIAVSAAAGAAVPDVIDFTWDYSENRANMARQNDSQVIPGDLLFRRDQDGMLLGGDPWSPRTTVTVGCTPLVAPANAGVMVFTFLGTLCWNTPETAVQAWLQRKSVLGV